MINKDGKEKRNVTITVRLEDKIYNEIRKQAYDYGISFNAMLKILLKNVVDKKQN